MSFMTTKFVIAVSTDRPGFLWWTSWCKERTSRVQ